MTASEVLSVAATVAITQAICDLCARHFVYSSDSYRRSVSVLERNKSRRDKIISGIADQQRQQQQQTSQTKQQHQQKASSKSSSKNAERNAKKIQKAEEDFAEAAAEVAKRHTSPGFFTSVIFLILYRILSTEYQGRVVAVLPFRPWNLIQRLSLRGLNMADSVVGLVNTEGEEGGVVLQKVSDPAQACSFLFVYLLCTFSVKFIVNKLVGVQPPAGADKGVGTLMDAPRNQKFLQSMGVDTDELKEIRKGW